MLTDHEAKPPGRERPQRARDSAAGRILRYSHIAIAIAAIYVVVVLFMRWHQNRRYEARMKMQEKAEQRAEDERSLETMGGSTFAIQGFYATPGQLARGESADLCYSVSNAQSVAIEPDTNRPIWPSLNRCIEITPKKTTTYTLTARDARGTVKTATLTIQVR
jgi:hypothetical protein